LRCNRGSQRKAHKMRTRYFGWEYVFEHICQRCDRDGLWEGDDASLAEEFRVSEDEAHCALGDLADQGLIETLYPGKFAIVKWRERDDPSGEEVGW
jgi:hypothetical protein